MDNYPCPVCDEPLPLAPSIDNPLDLDDAVARAIDAMDAHIEAEHPPTDLELIRIGIQAGYSEHAGPCSHDGQRVVIVGIDVLVPGHRMRLEADYPTLVSLQMQVEHALAECHAMAADGMHLELES